VDHGADRDIDQRQRVACFDVGRGAGYDGVALFEAVWREVVSLLAA